MSVSIRLTKKRDIRKEDLPDEVACERKRED